MQKAQAGQWAGMAPVLYWAVADHQLGEDWGRPNFTETNLYVSYHAASEPQASGKTSGLECGCVCGGEVGTRKGEVWETPLG